MSGAREEFADYCWRFYAPGEICGGTFRDALTREELDAAVDERMGHPRFEGDSVDREAVRDILLAAREGAGLPAAGDVRHNINNQLAVVSLKMEHVDRTGEVTREGLEAIAEAAEGIAASARGDPLGGS